MNNVLKILFLILFLLVTELNAIDKYSTIEQALKKYPSQDKKHGKKPKFIYFKMKRDRAGELDYFSKILYQFMQTMGVRPYFVNLNDNYLLGIVAREADVNKEAILETFSDAIESIEIKDN